MKMNLSGRSLIFATDKNIALDRDTFLQRSALKEVRENRINTKKRAARLKRTD